jgi:glycosyltransferase involved in cell wall biosynthesis
MQLKSQTGHLPDSEDSRADRLDPVACDPSSSPLKVCLVASELLGWGGAGGFGFATRGIARGLASLGHDVSVILPCPRGKAPERFELDGFRVVSYPRKSLLSSGSLFRALDADIYHSQEPSVATYLAQRAAPDKVHLVTLRDPRDWGDWWIEFNHPTFSRPRALLTIAAYQNPFTYRAVRKADAAFVPAKCLVEKARRKYRLDKPPVFLPTPVQVPASVHKSGRPTVCFVGRLDRRKCPERFIDLAARFPEALFKVAGTSQDPQYQRELELRCKGLANLEMLGFIDQFGDSRLSQLLSESWVMVNTSGREGLPNSFIEAAGHGCAIVSELDPDHFTSRYGEIATGGDFAGALSRLLESGVWAERGARGREYVQRTNDPQIAIARHLDHYRAAMAAKPSRA